MVPWGHSDMEIAVGNAVSLGTSTVPAIPHGESQLILDKGSLLIIYDPSLDHAGICIEKEINEALCLAHIKNGKWIVSLK